MMSKKGVMVFVAVGIALIGTVSEGLSEDAGRYYNGPKGFSISFPETWEQQEGLRGTVVLAVSPPEDPEDPFRESVNVVVHELPEPVGMEEYIEKNMAAMNDMLTGFQKHETGQLSIDNTEAEWLVYSYRMETVEIRVLTYVLLKDVRAYVITCTGLPDRFLEYQGTFEEVALSFRFEEPAGSAQP